MFRRFLLTSCKGAFFLLLLISIGCSAQLSPADLSQRIEHQLRVSYDLPETMKITISPLRASEFPNYDALTVTLDDQGKKKNVDFLLSKDQKTLVRFTKMDLTKDPYAEIMKKIDIKGRPVRGNPNAKVVVVSFDDFECPFCSRAHRALFPELLKEYGDRVAFIYKDFPLSEMHPWAVHAAVDANCLAAESNDAYWDFADYIHSNQVEVNSVKGLDDQLAKLDSITLNEATKFKVDPGPLQACMKAQNKDAINASIKEGESLGIDGTPTLFVNGRLIDGARSADEFRAILDSALEQAGVAPPPHPGSAPKVSENAGAAANPH
ncbi:MAG TPA: thioredoxin domain-containing protein [Terriglobales bacterium]|nr:thioredoxin domain-containing protein [Terriglobales bacterium]